MKKSLLSLAVTAALLSGCTLIPDYERPEAPIAGTWPEGDAYGFNDMGSASMTAADIDWQDFFRDPALKQLIQLALDNNRDLRAAALNVESYRALYRVQRAELFPDVSVGVDGTRQRIPSGLSTTGDSMISSQYNGALAINAWELDFFGRIRSLNQQALEQFFASEAAQRSTHISLVASVANAYLLWLSDQALLNVTRDTLKTYEESYRLTQRSFDVGVADALELSQARTAFETAQVALAQYTRLVALDRNALTQLIGTGIPENLAQGMDINSDMLRDIPAGLPSDILQRRPDVLQAEHQLKAANANIGAARAAFFPSISLTASAGSASENLSNLFDAGTGAWMFKPQINLPIFNAGRLRANLDYARLQQEVQVAQYEKAIQVAFQEVADGLASRKTYAQQLEYQRNLVKTSENYYNLADRRYQAGVDSYLVLLDAQRQLFSARQQLITDRYNQLRSEIELYKALGGGWTDPNRDQASATSTP